MEGRDTTITLLLLLQFLHFFPISEQVSETSLDDGYHQLLNIGVTYNETDKEDLPPPEDVVKAILENGIKFVRLINPDGATLSAFSGSGIDLSLSFERLEFLQYLGGSYNFSLEWAKENLSPYSSKLSISSVSVGYGVLNRNPELSHLLLPAISNLYRACDELDLKYKVTTAHSFDIVEKIFPPSGAMFRAAYVPYLAALLAHDVKINSTFMIDLFGFYVYRNKLIDGLRLSFVTFKVTSWQPGMWDGGTATTYSSLFDLMLDALASSLVRIGHGGMAVTIVGIGWPSSGEMPEEQKLSAAEYNGGLAMRIRENRPSPLLCVPQTTYIYGLLNEKRSSNHKSYENHWGILSDNLIPKYRLMFEEVYDEENDESSGGKGQRKVVAFTAGAVVAALWFNLFLLF